jgi:hypothetical protein
MLSTRRTITTALAAFLAIALAAPAAPASVPTFKGSSTDGEVAFFETDEKLVPGDTDGKRDVYERSFDPLVGESGAYVTREVSTGPTGGNDAYHAQFEAAGAAGDVIFFSTEETLVAADTDRKLDLYARDLETGQTALVSQSSDACAPACGNGAIDAGFAAAEGGGAAAFFVTEESLLAADTDSAVDIYRRNLLTETTTLVSVAGAPCTGSCGNGAHNAVMWGLSADGSTAFFTTAESLVSADADAVTDVYARDLTGGATLLVSQADASCAGCGNTSAVPVFRASSADGSRAFFLSAEKLVAADDDAATDVYARDLPGGPTMLVSSGGTEDVTAAFAATDATGANTFFTTSEALAGGDVNGANDVYRWTGGAPSLITSGTCTQGAGAGCGSTFNAAVGSTEAIFTTTESLVLPDGDTSADVYSQALAGGEPTLLTQGDSECAPTCGNGAVDAKFNAVADGGAKFLFSSNESLLAADGDTTADIYMHDTSDSSIGLVSVPGFCPVPAKSGGCAADFRGASAAGDHVFFNTAERLSLEENDAEVDIYERAFGPGPGEETTRLVSVGNSPDLELGPSTPVLEETLPASPSTSTTPSIAGQADAETSIKLYREANCTGAVAKTGTAAELAGAGIQVTVAGGSTTTFWATATDIHGDTSACSNPISYTHENPVPPGGGGGGSGAGGGTTAGGGDGSGGAVSSPPDPGGVDYVAPKTRITFGPASKTRQRRPVFRFTDSTGQADTTFFCKLDRKPWKACGSPLRLKGLSRGRHVFRVKGRNGAGDWEAQPATRRFKLVASR